MANHAAIFDNWLNLLVKVNGLRGSRCWLSETVIDIARAIKFIKLHYPEGGTA